MSLVLFILMILVSKLTADSEPERELGLLFDFTGENASRAWMAVNDGVMGGRSSGGARIVAGGMEFTGTLSLENNGGFASLRQSVNLDLSEYSGIYLKVKGDGRTYQLRTESTARLWGRWPVSFSTEFKTEAGQWQEFYLPFAGQTQGWRGRELRGYSFDKSEVRMLGLLLGDKTPGPFTLQVESLGVYK
ncbi:MAG: CIA30 family protein [Verrucomicrobiota bacterium]